MNKFRILLAFFLLCFFLNGCALKQKPLLIDGDFDRYVLFIEGKKIDGTTDLENVVPLLEKINSSEYEKVSKNELTSPEGELIFEGKKDKVTLGVYKNGDLLYQNILIKSVLQLK